MSIQQRRLTDGILRLALRRVGGRTVISQCCYHVPLQVLRPAYLDNTGTAYVYLLNPCGGLLGGDTYTMTIALEAGAQAVFTTPSATKLYAAPHAATRQTIDCTVGADAIFTYMPEQLIPFADAALQQRITVHLERGACAFVGDILAPGRIARGEVFAYREYDARLRVYDAEGRPLVLERTLLRPRQHRLDGRGMFEGYTYLGTLYALCEGRSLEPTLPDALHALLAGRDTLIASATALAQSGLVVRILAADHSSISQAMFEAWDMLRQHLLGYPAVRCRT